MSKSKILTSLLTAILSIAVVTSASAQECRVPTAEFMHVNVPDSERIVNFAETRTIALGEALNSDNAEDRAIVSAIFANGFQPLSPDKVIDGTYQCRTIKLGGLAPITSYQWFSCEINHEEAVLTVRKVTGSQNFFGVMYPVSDTDGVLFYKGASHYGYEDQIRMYGDDEERNQVGCMSAINTKAGHFVLELPRPQFESTHDLIEFKRN